jgi:hypothetical protein
MKFRKLSTNYKKDSVTIQQQLTAEQIDQMLAGYKQIKNFDDITIGTHIRYFVTDLTTGETKFRMGGYLHKKDQADLFVVLQGTKGTFCVQVNDHTMFFARRSAKEEIEDLKRIYAEKLKEKDEEVKELNRTVKRIFNAYNQLVEQNNRIK